MEHEESAEQYIPKPWLFTQEIKGYITESGLSQAHIARKLGLEPDTFNRQVNFSRRMPDRVIFDFCRLLKIGESQRAELLILAGYAVLPRIEGGRETGRVPIQKLQSVPHFVGREQEMKLVLDCLHPGHIVTLVGPGGIGKTQIAAKAVERLAPGVDPSERFPDGIVFYSFYGENKNGYEKALEHIITSFGEKPGPSLDETALAVLARKRALLWLDGTERADNLNRVLDVRGTLCGVLITSQSRNDIKEFGLDILRLPFEYADALMRAVGGDSARQKKARERIYELVGDVTLAIELAGAHLRDLQEEGQLEDYLTWLSERRLEALHSGDHRRESVYVLMKQSVSLVSKRFGEGVRLVLALMGILACQPVSPTVLAASLGVQKYDVKQLLEGLVDYSLLFRDGNRYTVRHNMIYDYIKRYVRAPDEVVTKLATYYSTLVEVQSERGLRGYKRIEPERVHIVTVVTGLVARHLWNEAQRLVWDIDSYLDLQGYWTDRVDVLQAGLTAAKALQDPYVEGAFLIELGNVFHLKGDWDQALTYHERAQQSFEQRQDVLGLAAAYNNLGAFYADMGEWDSSLKYLEQAQRRFRELEDDAGSAMNLHNFGVHCAHTGEWYLALKYYQKSAQMMKQLRDFHGLALTSNSVGNVYADKGEWDRALKFYRQALRMYERIGDIHGLALTYNNLGTFYVNTGEWDLAIEHYEESARRKKQLGDIHGLATTWSNIGYTYLDTGRVEDAKPYFANAILTFARMGSPKLKNATAGLVEACGSHEAANAYLAHIRKDLEATDSE